MHTNFEYKTYLISSYSGTISGQQHCRHYPKQPKNPIPSNDRRERGLHNLQSQGCPGTETLSHSDVDYVINFFYITKLHKDVDTGIIPQYKFGLQDYDAVAGLVGNVKVIIGEHITSCLNLKSL